MSVCLVRLIAQSVGYYKHNSIAIQCLPFLSQNMKAVLSVDDLVQRFRANLVVGGDAPPFLEDMWTEVSIGNLHFEVQSLYTCVHVCVCVCMCVCVCACVRAVFVCMHTNVSAFQSAYECMYVHT